MLIIRPPGDAGRKAPSTDAGEEVALRVTGEVICVDIDDAPFIHIAWCDVPANYQIAQPLRCIGIDLVVIGCHGRASHLMRDPSSYPGCLRIQSAVTICLP